MELYQLRTFLMVASEGHLTRAAEKLHTSQPAVSAQIRALEEETGMPLFLRTTRGMELTEAGKNLMPKARDVVEAAKDFTHHAGLLRKRVSGEMVIGMNNRPEILRLMPILQTVSSEHPDLRYRLVSGSSGVLLQGMEEGLITAGFFEGECPAKIESEALTTIELCIVGPREWKDEISRCDWKLLENKPWIFVSPQCSYFRAIENLCQMQGLVLKPRFEVNEDLTVLGLVAGGLGLTVTSRRLVEKYPDKDKLVCLPHFGMTVMLQFGHLRSRSQDPAIQILNQAVRQHWGEPKTEQLRRVR